VDARCGVYCAGLESRSVLDLALRGASTPAAMRQPRASLSHSRPSARPCCPRSPPHVWHLLRRQRAPRIVSALLVYVEWKPRQFAGTDADIATALCAFVCGLNGAGAARSASTRCTTDRFGIGGRKRISRLRIRGGAWRPKSVTRGRDCSSPRTLATRIGSH
jgi:hypothetical protein